jgi:hypothetical protein
MKTLKIISIPITIAALGYVLGTGIEGFAAAMVAIFVLYKLETK